MDQNIIIPFLFLCRKLRVCKNLLWKSLTAGSRQQTTARKISPNWIALRKDYRKFEKEPNIAAFDPVSRDSALVSFGRGSDGSFVFTSVGAQSMAFSSHSEFRVTHFGTPTGNAVLETCISMKEDKKSKQGLGDLRWKESSSRVLQTFFLL